jgi:hypothetical protein
VNQFQRLLLAVIIVIVDWAVFFVPLSGVFLAYVILVNPPWVRNFLNGLDAPSGPPGGDGS